jgi:hypothetical protein
MNYIYTTALTTMLLRTNYLKQGIFILFFFTLFSAIAQDQEWHAIMGDSNFETVTDITTDVNGDILSTGHYAFTVDFDPTPSVYNLTNTGSCELGDPFVQKLDKCRNLIWAKGFGSSTIDIARSIITDSLGDVYVTGYYTGVADLNPGQGSDMHPNRGSRDVFIVKLNTNGNFVWAKSIGSVQSDDVWSIAIDDSLNVVVTGTFGDTIDLDPGPAVSQFVPSGSYDIFILKLNQNGDHIWSGAIGGPNTNTAPELLTDSSNIYIAGNFSGTADFDPGPGILNQTATGSSDAFILKLDYWGNVNWFQSFESSGSHYISSAAINGNLLSIAGGFSDSLDADLGAGVNYLVAQFGFAECLITMDLNGNLQWAHHWTGTSAPELYAYEVTIDSAGSVYLSGQFVNGGDIDPGPGVTSISTFNGALFLSKFNSTGDFQWVKVMDAIMWSNSIVNSVAIYGDDIYAGCQFSGVVDIDTGPGYSPVSSVDTAYPDALIMKFTQLPIQPPTPYVGTLPDSANDCSITPNTPYAYMECMDSIPGIPDISFPITTVGTTTVTWTYNGYDGLSSTQTQNIIINPINTLVSTAGNTLHANANGAIYQWLDCDSGMVAIAGETNQDYTPIASGNYAVVVTVSGCSDTSSCHSITIVGTADLSISELVKIHPNPSNGTFHIDLTHAQKDVEISIINQLGGVVLNDQFAEMTELDMNLEIAPGIYYLSISSAKNRPVIQKLIIH